MSCQQNLNLLENRTFRALDAKANISTCVGCQDLQKEIVGKDKIIAELQHRLDSIHEMSATTKGTTLPQEDLTQKFQITSFNLGIGIPVVQESKSFSSTASSCLIDSDSSSAMDTHHHNVNGKSTESSSTSSLFQLFQHCEEFPQQQEGDHHEVTKMVTVQQIIDKVIEKTPDHGNNRFLQPNNCQSEDKIITVQEIIDNIVEKSDNELSFKRKLENFCECCCNKLGNTGTWCKLFAAFEA